MGTRIGRFIAVTAPLAGLFLTAGCVFGLEEESGCIATTLSPSLHEGYSLPELPEAEGIKFCEGSDKDGTWARLTFQSAPGDAQAYLNGLDLSPDEFTPVPSSKVDELAQSGREGWALTEGLEYKRGGKSREYNGHCLVDYKAYIQNSVDWDGRVYIGMYCAV
ncbi:hypothetical protein AB0892_22215 [Streptomyces sp. NPDC005409]|uniref:hypothetical protein n=1 Tax=Streptomyces sp. NPDC005409 TaxID=3155342 RepID=UPI0034516396